MIVLCVSYSYLLKNKAEILYCYVLMILLIYKNEKLSIPEFN